MASRVFKCDVLVILTSDIDKNANRASLGSTERSRVNSMSIIIMSAEDLLENRSRHMMNIDGFHD